MTLAEALGLIALPAGDLRDSLPHADVLEMELHLAAARDYLLLLCPGSDFPEEGAQGAHIGALFANLASAPKRGGSHGFRRAACGCAG